MESRVGYSILQGQFNTCSLIFSFKNQRARGIIFDANHKAEARWTPRCQFWCRGGAEHQGDMYKRWPVACWLNRNCYFIIFWLIHTKYRSRHGLHHRPSPWSLTRRLTHQNRTTISAGVAKRPSANGILLSQKPFKSLVGAAECYPTSNGILRSVIG